MITSAGVVLAATFAALAVLPILFLAQIAFIVAFGVLLDTLLVRSLLVPALAARRRPAHLVAVPAGPQAVSVPAGGNCARPVDGGSATVTAMVRDFFSTPPPRR